MLRKVLIPLFIIPLLIACDRDTATHENYVVMVSFDGCRWDYPDLYKTPTLDKMAAGGVKAERVISSFPTKTFPNHYAIATGLYPDHHGLINNSFYAPDLDLFYRIGNREMVQNGDFYGGEPIWNTAAKQGVTTASFFWVGSEAPVQGMQPAYWKTYDGSIPYAARVDTVIHWLKLPLEKRPRLVLLYFDQPDGIGHDYGPVHPGTGKVMEELDEILGTLRRKINRLPYGERVNLIVTSDHGMGAISPERYVNLNDHVKEHWIEDVAGGNPMYLVDAKADYEDSVALALDRVEGITAWPKDRVPAHLNYGTHPRITDVVVVADSSWSVGTSPDPSGYTGGAHGYDNSNTDMHHIFYAEGPAFKSGYLHPPFENVDIYPLIAEILGLDPAPVDGRLEDVNGMLKE
jgi:alkaline phosphatase D